MKKILTICFALIAALCLCLGITACDGTKETPNAPSIESPSDPNGGETPDPNGGDVSDPNGENPSHTHVAETFNVDDSTHWKVCTVCGEKFAEGKHSFDSSNACKTCGYTLVYTKGLEYSLNEEADTYTVTGIGEAEGATELTIPAYHEGKAVTSIGDYAFWNCTSLTSIEIPDSVTSIGEDAFNGCSSLTSIEIPDSVTSIGYEAFDGCTSLTSIKIPAGVTSIGNQTFRGCTSLMSIEIPHSVTLIGDQAFRGCTSLKSIVIPDGVTSIWYYAFADCSSLKSIVIPDSVTSIGYAAFQVCDSLTSIDIPDSVTSIASSAFYGTAYYNYASHWDDSGVLYIGNHLIEAKETISGAYTIRAGTKTIAGDAFYHCTSLTSIEIPDSVTSIGYEAFDGCTSLTSIEIPDGVTSIGNRAFSGCYKLIEVWNHSDLPIEKGTDSYSDVAYYAKNVYQGDEPSKQTVTDDGYIFYEDGEENYLLGYLGDETALTLPQMGPSGNQYAIYQYAFYRISLTSVDIPDSVTSIGDCAFEYCRSLTSVTFAETEGWFVSKNANATSGTEISSENLQDPATAANYLKNTYRAYYWKQK